MAKSMPPLSLVQYFDAPDDYRSSFGWVCGYSADALFLNQAIERFTRETRAQRASRGALSVALMLDPRHPAIGPVEVPGLVHLPIAQADNWPFRLLHAKVALLGFRHAGGGQPLAGTFSCLNRQLDKTDGGRKPRSGLVNRCDIRRS